MFSHLWLGLGTVEWGLFSCKGTFGPPTQLLAPVLTQVIRSSQHPWPGAKVYRLSSLSQCTISLVLICSHCFGCLEVKQSAMQAV